jgi:hypothetical protein
VSLSEGAMGGGRDEENVREWKYWNNSSIYEYNIMHYTVSCWILVEHGDRRWVSKEEERLMW